MLNNCKNIINRTFFRVSAIAMILAVSAACGSVEGEAEEAGLEIAQTSEGLTVAEYTCSKKKLGDTCQISRMYRPSTCQINSAGNLSCGGI